MGVGFWPLLAQTPFLAVALVMSEIVTDGSATCRYHVDYFCDIPCFCWKDQCLTYLGLINHINNDDWKMDLGDLSLIQKNLENYSCLRHHCTTTTELSKWACASLRELARTSFAEIWGIVACGMPARSRFLIWFQMAHAILICFELGPVQFFKRNSKEY